MGGKRYIWVKILADHFLALDGVLDDTEALLSHRNNRTTMLLPRLTVETKLILGESSPDGSPSLYMALIKTPFL